MAISVKHKFQSAKADSSDVSLIRPSNWNDDHDISIAGQRLLGRYSTGTGVAQEISLGTGLGWSSSTIAVTYGTAAGTAAQGNDSRIVNAVPGTRTVTAGTGLSGGGALSANITLSVTYGTAAGTAAQGNDSRITGALQASNVVSRAEAQAGTATTARAWTAQRVAQAIAAQVSAIGDNQSWQSVSRTVNTVYQNTTGKPIQVQVYGATTYGAHTFQVSVNSSTWVDVAVLGSSFIRAFPIVPINNYYRFIVSSGSPISTPNFLELR